MGEITVINGMNTVELADLLGEEEDHTHKIGNMETGPEVPTIKGRHIHEIPGIGKTDAQPDGGDHKHAVSSKTGGTIEEAKGKKKKDSTSYSSPKPKKKKKKKA